MKEKEMENFQDPLKKALNVAYHLMHPGNNKKKVQLVLAASHETTTAMIRSYFPNPLEAANIFSFF